MIQELSKMPGVGQRTAERLAFYILKISPEEVRKLSEAISEAKEKAHCCRICNHLSEGEICQICQDAGRDRTVLCVVEEPKDVISLEKTGEFKGIYHVLLGALSPLEGIGPDDIKLEELVVRVKNSSPAIREVIIATNSDNEGEATALYLTKLLKSLGIKLTRIAYGIPVGAAIEFMDQVTLGRALAGRLEI